MKTIWRKLLVALLLCALLLPMAACQRPATNEMQALYELAQEGGFTGSYEEWLNAMKGVPGEKGAAGDAGAAGEKGETGDNGLSTYELYCKYHPKYRGSEEEWVTALSDGSLAASYENQYNIIFTLATIPPVLASLDAVKNGFETYACIERGKTYNGIAALSNFHVVSFSTTSNQSDGFTNEQMDAMVAQIKELNRFGNERFHIYVQDGTGLAGFALAANAELTADQYDIILCEDGSGAYERFRMFYLDGKTVSAEKDEPYELFMEQVAQTKSAVESILSKTDNRYTDYGYDIPRAATIAVLDGVSYWYQDMDRMADVLKKTDDGTNHSKLLSVFCVDGYTDEVDCRVNIRCDSISNMVESLDEKEKGDYLQLMYGSAYQATYDALVRETLSDGVTPVPDKKLVFIGGRINSYPTLATDAAYGVGGLGENESVPATYEELPARFKSPLLFGTKADYDIFLEELAETANYTKTLDAETARLVAKSCFHYYINYMYTLKFTYAMYGEDYDIILKGHPREVLGDFDQWTSHYIAGDYTYDLLMNRAVERFHESDSVGRMIGTVPYGTAAENLAYLGVEMAIGGLYSSTYMGYEPAVDMKFVIYATDADIYADGNLNSRLEAGTLLNHDENGAVCLTDYYNVGNFYKTLQAYYLAQGDTASAARFESLLNAWLRKMNNLDANADLTGYGVDDQGTLIVPQS